MMALSEVNAMPSAAFVMAFGDVAEHSPWVAEKAAISRPYSNREAMIAAFASVLAAAPRPAQLALINAHPDLATKAKLTTDSTQEQAGAGLGHLSASEFDEFTHLNTTYKTNFGFPFIFAVKGATSAMILESFRERIQNSTATEFKNALTQITRIFRFRLEDRISPT